MDHGGGGGGAGTTHHPTRIGEGESLRTHESGKCLPGHNRGRARTIREKSGDGFSMNLRGKGSSKKRERHQVGKGKY